MSRFRRLRRTETLRALVRETRLSTAELIQPFFVMEGKQKKQAIDSMPGINRYSVDRLLRAVEHYQSVGGRAVILFGIPSKKDFKGSQAYSAGGIVQKALKAIKKTFPKLLVITDVCLCAYTTHGHCGIVVGGQVDNDRTLPVLAKIALSHAEAGADIVAPSDMMDLRVKEIRQGLDKNNFIHIPILSYAVKYASAFYGPFRAAVDSTPQFGDRKSYQMDYANTREALKEAWQDVCEEADILMIKPALAYLDVISLIKYHTTLPIAAFSVSGEYSMIKAAAMAGWLNEKDAVLESLTAMKRAGADIIITYYAQEAMRWLTEGP